jgi:Flp pilus assembly pilin Flp
MKENIRVEQSKITVITIIARVIMTLILVLMLYSVFYATPIIPDWLTTGMIYFYAIIGWVLGIVSVVMVIALNSGKNVKEIWQKINEEFVQKTTLNLIHIFIMSFGAAILLLSVGFVYAGWLYVIGTIYYFLAGVMSQYKI